MELSPKQSIILLFIAFFMLGIATGSQISNYKITTKFQEVANTQWVVKAGDNYYKIISVNYTTDCNAPLCMNYTITDKWNGK